MASTWTMITARALLLDVDGLMVDSEPLWFEVEHDFARSRGGDWTAQHARAALGKGQASALRAMAELGMRVDPSRDLVELEDRFLVRAGELRVKPGCRELLAAARGRVPVAAASSSVIRLVSAVLDVLGLAPNFDAVVGGDEVAHPKPAPDIFLTAAARLGVEPVGCVVLEDSLAGAMAGRAARMEVIAVPEWPTEGLDDVATRVVGSLLEARHILRFER